AIRYEHARRLETPKSARARGAGDTGPRCTMAALPPGCAPGEGRGGLDRAISPPVGGTVRPAGDLPARAAAERQDTWSQARGAVRPLRGAGERDLRGCRRQDTVDADDPPSDKGSSR